MYIFSHKADCYFSSPIKILLFLSNHRIVRVTVAMFKWIICFFGLGSVCANVFAQESSVIKVVRMIQKSSNLIPNVFVVRTVAEQVISVFFIFLAEKAVMGIYLDLLTCDLQLIIINANKFDFFFRRKRDGNGCLISHTESAMAIKSDNVI